MVLGYFNPSLVYDFLIFPMTVNRKGIDPLPNFASPSDDSHRFISKPWHVFKHHKSTINSPRFYQHRTTLCPSNYHEKYPFFAKPHPKTPLRK
jgi:hypothetical protein